MKRKLWLISVIGALVGLSLTAQGSVAEPNRCFGIWISGAKPSADVSHSRLRRRGRSFSVRDVDALEFQVRLPAGLPGSHRVELKLYTPHGDLYQTLTAIHSSTRDEGGTERSGQRVRRRRWEYVTLRLPVAATTIVRSSLYGRWRVDAHLDGASQACTWRRFAIEP